MPSVKARLAGRSEKRAHPDPACRAHFTNGNVTREVAMGRRSKPLSRAANPHKRSKAAPAKGPAVNPRSIELALLWFMSEGNASDSEESRTRLSMLESEIAKQNKAKAALQKLLADRCDRGLLLRSLGLSCGRPVDSIFDGWFTKPGPQSLQGLFSLESRAFSTLRDLLLEAADRIDGINRHFEFGILLTAHDLQMFQGIPSLLQGYVSLLDLAAKRLAGGAHFYRNMGKAILTLYVKQETGRFHDPEVAELLAAVKGSDNYEARGHIKWREEQKKLLSNLSPVIPIFTSGLVRDAIEKLSENSKSAHLQSRLRK
jgi:hypothetical protein